MTAGSGHPELQVTAYTTGAAFAGARKSGRLRGPYGRYHDLLTPYTGPRVSRLRGMRMAMRRFTNGLSEKAENHVLMVSLHFMHYNFCRIHKTLRTSPAMAAKVSDRLWSIEDIVDMVDARAEPPKRPATYRKRVRS
jgi:hypothetical protein